MTQPGEFHQRDRGIHPPAFTPDYKTSVARSPRYSLISLQNSVSEVTGPRFGHADIDAGDNDLLTNYAAAGESPIGERIILHGRAAQLVRDFADSHACTRASAVRAFVYHACGVPGQPILEPFGGGSEKEGAK